MGVLATNSSSSTSVNYWTNCIDDGNLSGLSTGMLILFITYVFEFLVGVPSNLWLVCHILRKMSKVSGILPADFFPLHLALTQLVFFLIVPLHFVNQFLWQTWLFQVMVSVLTSLVVVMKPLLLCLVCVQRYMAVVRPLLYQRYNAPKYRWGCLAVSWCFSVLMMLAAVVDSPSITVLVVFPPVLVVDTFCSWSVLKTLKKPPPGDRQVTERDKKAEETHQTGRQVVRMEQSSQGGIKAKEVVRSEPRGKGEMNSSKRKAFNTIAIIQTVLTVNYLPYIICLCLDGVVPAWTLRCQFKTTAFAAVVSCTYLQPLLYLHRLGRLPFMTPKNT